MRVLRIVLLVCTSLCFLATLIVNLLGSSGVGAGGSRTGNPNNTDLWDQRDTVQTPLTPIGWAFSVWGLIYLFQLAWLVYCWTTAFRRLHPNGEFLCCEPNLAPVGLLVWYFFSGLFNMAWIIISDRVMSDKYLRIPQVCILFGITFCLYATLISSYWNLALAKDTLYQWNKRVDYILTVGLVQNGISLYAGWVTVASFVNLNSTLNVLTSLGENDVSSIICLSFVIAIITVYAVADLTILDQFTRFVFTPHLVVIWACGGVLAKNFKAGSAPTIMTLSLIGLVAVALVVKFVGIWLRTMTTVCDRSKTKPLGHSQEFKLDR